VRQHLLVPADYRIAPSASDTAAVQGRRRRWPREHVLAPKRRYALHFPDPVRNEMTPPAAPTQTAVLGGGCFWCLEAVFDRLRGVQAVESGYAGGRTADPTYEDVCSGSTGHAEVVRVSFDSTVLTFRDLLRVFFAIHDPTTRDRQGSDAGTQYRSVIFCQTPEQRKDAEAVIAELTQAKLWTDPIVTEVADAATFYPAEQYHQQYFERNGRQPYCQFVVAPKVAKFRKEFVDRLKELGS
jgi:peptide-methionine (S)-S-oxide reductase